MQQSPDDIYKIENERLTFALNAAGIGTWDLDPIHNTVIWDERCRELFGFAPNAQVPYRDVLKYMHPDDAVKVDLAVQKALDPSTAGEYEVRYRTIGETDGRQRWVLSKGKVYFNTDGTAYRFAGTAQDITESINERERSNASEKIAQIALENSNSGYFYVSLITDEMQFSSGYSRILTGNTDPTLKHTDFVKYIHPDDRELRAQAHKIAYETNKLDYEARVIWDDGSIHWMRAKGNFLLDTSGNPYLLTGTIHDTTAEHLHKQAVKDAEDILSAAFDNASVGMAFTDLEGRFLKVNTAYAALLGYTEEEFRTDKFLNITHPDDREWNAQLYNELVTGKRHYFNLSKRYIHKNGTVKWVQVNVTRITAISGNAGRVMTIARDVSAEMESEKAFSQVQSMFRNVTSGAPTGLWLSDEQGGLIYLNDTLVQWTGMPYNELLGTGWANAIIEEDRLNGATVFMNAIATRSHYDVMFRIKKGTGEIVWCRAAGDPYYNENGSYAGYAGFCMDINDLVNMANELKAGEAHFRSLIEEAPVATCLFVGKDMRIEVANEIMLGYWGKGDSVLGKPLVAAIPELGDQAFPRILDEVFTTGIPYEAKAAATRLEINGIMDTYYFDFTYKPLRNATGDVYAIMDMAVDVTEEVMARKQLEESELFSRNVIENSPVAKVVFVGRDMVIRTVNEKMLEMLGRDNSIIGMPFMDAVPELIPTPLMDRLRNVLDTGETMHQPEEKIDLIKFGAPYTGYYNYIYKALRNTLGEIYGIIVTATEVTEQVVARKTIEEAESNLRGAIELAELGTWQIDLGTRILDYSERLRDWSGIGYDEIITVERAYAPICEADRPKVKAAMTHAITMGTDGLYDVEYTTDDTVAKKRILHAQGKTFYNEDGVPYKISGTVQDVTQQRTIQLALEEEVQLRTQELQAVNEELTAMNEELNESNDRLIRSNEELAQYAYVASHDLQEPLRKIIMFSGMLQKQTSLPEESKPLINKIANSTERMSMLIHDLLDFSRLLKSETLMRPVDLSTVLIGVKEDFDLTIEEKKAVVNIGPLPVIEAVSLQMNQLFYNLINNALKFTKQGIPPVLTIYASSITHHEAAKYIPKTVADTIYHHITFTDNGIGFETKYSEHIFEIFKRLHGRNVFPGSGIGLALCRRIVTNHNGHIYAESTPGMGASFHIIIPEKQYVNETQAIEGTLETSQN